MSDLPRLLLHICCAPDATAVWERLSIQYAVTGYFHNPNIFPEEEHARRLENAHRVAAHFGFPLAPAPYEPKAWQAAVRGLEREPERGARCVSCFQHNLNATAAAAASGQFTYFSTTLTISPHKDAAMIFQAGAAAARFHGVHFVPIDFKKQAGFQRSLEWSRRLGLYRQNYCGCEYSLRPEKTTA